MQATPRKMGRRFTAFALTFVVVGAVFIGVGVLAFDNYDPAIGWRMSICLLALSDVVFALVAAICWSGASLLIMRISRLPPAPVWCACLAGLASLVALHAWPWSGIEGLMVPVLLVPGTLGWIMPFLGRHDEARTSARHHRGVRRTSAGDDAPGRS